MKQEYIKEHFKKQADDYIGLMNKLVPQYMEQQKFLCELIPFNRDQSIRVLDLGSGPGILSEIVLRLFPQAHVVAFDLTEEMLNVCKQRLSKFVGRFEIRQGDFKTDSFDSGYDVILAGLTLHHLSDDERKNIFIKFYNALNENGMFLAREIVIDEDPFITSWHYSLWRSFIKSNEEDDIFWYEKHKEKDHPISIENEMIWLRNAGFIHTACHWQYWNFAIMSGHKIEII